MTQSDYIESCDRMTFITSDALTINSIDAESPSDLKTNQEKADTKLVLEYVKLATETYIFIGFAVLTCKLNVKICLLIHMYICHMHENC